MKVFVAGATGVIGKRAVARLVAAGHDVTGVARSEEKAALLRSLGAGPVAVDLFDAEAVRAAVAGHDAVVNLTTKIPPLHRMARRSAWDENNRIRREVSRNLAEAATVAGAGVFVQESLAFMYGHHRDDWIDEETPVFESIHTEAMRAAEAAAQRFTDAGGRGVALRFGRFAAPDSDQTATLVRAAGLGVHGEPGPDGVYLTTIHADDAASAVVAALDAPAGTYNVVDDRPMTRAEHREALGAAVGRRLRRLPAFALRFAGPSAAAFAASQRVSNRRFRQATGWAPQHPDAGATYRSLVTALEASRPKLSTGLRAVLWFLALNGVALGVQALVSPSWFYDDFPFGRSWVSADGPYNEHLLRDFGALNLALASMAIAALVTRRPAVARATGLAWMVYGVPHLLYHLFNLDPYGTADAVANVTALVTVVVVPTLALVLPAPAARPAPTGPADSVAGSSRSDASEVPSPA